MSFCRSYSFKILVPNFVFKTNKATAPPNFISLGEKIKSGGAKAFLDGDENKSNENFYRADNSGGNCLSTFGRSFKSASSHIVRKIVRATFCILT